LGKKLSQVPSRSGEIIAEDLEHKRIKKDWNKYELADCATLKVKIVMQKICSELMDDEKTIRYTVSIVPDVPEELKKSSERVEH
jgi:hypothetical protein